ncbi:MAG: isoaspartyl peptidase/L-asparaginase [Acidobacteriia bacterium]|nr:isoaspartyl peptidase/L-asparaginase [Terriglobia bacterium]
MKKALIVHGGCAAVSAEEELVREAACERSAEEGWKVLEAGGTAVDAVDVAIRRLEDEPVLNAGTGSYLQADGVARMDASIMASDGRAGAVAQVPGLKNPIRLARYLLQCDAHVMLCGIEATQLGLKLGHESGVVATPQKIAYWQQHMTDACLQLDYERMGKDWKNGHPRLGTVGCVALDGHGDLAAGTSTGGTGQCYPGRVGDSPIIGAGTYCTTKAAVSLTGVGERIMVLLSAKRLCDLVADGKSLDAAGRATMAEIETLATASAGLIAVDADGTLITLWDTPFMATARRGGRME